MDKMNELENKFFPSNNKNTLLDLSPEIAEEVLSCVNNAEGKNKRLHGALAGTMLSTVLAWVFKIPKVHILPCVLAGTIYGYISGRYFHNIKCISNVVEINVKASQNPEEKLTYYVEENQKTFLEKERFEPNLDLPSTEQSDDISENKVTEGVTYKQLRDKYRQRNMPIVVNPRQKELESQRKKQQFAKQEEEDGAMEIVEPDVFPATGTGKHRTKYGDVWD